MVQENVNVHAGEETATAPTSTETASALRQKKANLGSRGDAEFIAFSAALSTLGKGIVAAINDKVSQSKTLADNKLSLSTSRLQSPTVKPPGLNEANRTVSANLSGITTEDTKTVQKSMGLASNVRDPSGLNEFESKSIDQENKILNEEINELSEALKVVNGLKKQVEST